MAPFRRLTVWKKAHELVLRVYQATAHLPEWQYPGVAAQLRGSAAAVAARIVEGTGRESPAEFTDDLDGALRLVRELDYRLLLAADLGALGRSDYARLNARIDQVCRMLVALRKTVQQRGRAAAPPSAGRRRSAANASASARSA